MTVEERNKALCDKYPWLYPRNVWTDEKVEDYDYSYTLLDQMPTGWRLAFGEQMCEELRKVLAKANYEKDYRVVQIKEKYGELRWYDNGAPVTIFDEIQKIIGKYSNLSQKICICCGKPATRISLGWISPWCDECSPKNEKTISIEEWESEDLI